MVVLTPERFDALLDLIQAHLDDWQLHPIANLEVDQLLDATSDAFRPDALAGPDPESTIPRERWGVGHFVGIGALWRDGAGRRWVLLLDTYKARGFSGYVPMPAESLRRAVVREDGRTGGLLLVMPRASLEAAATAIGDARSRDQDVGQRQPRARGLGVVTRALTDLWAWGGLWGSNP